MESMDEVTDERIISLENRIMYLEDSLSQISMEILKKDRMLESLGRKAALLEERLKELDERKADRDNGETLEEQPPHY